MTVVDLSAPDASDHGALAGLGDDDHAQYLLLSGRVGGQEAIGGTGVGDELGLIGSSDAGLGRVIVRSPFEIDDVSAGDTVAIRYRPTFTTAGAFVGGLISDQIDITYDNSLFIWALLAEAGVYRAAVDPGFAAFTLFNALPAIVNDGDFNLVQAIVLNASPSHARSSAGTSTTTTTIGLQFTAQMRATVAGAVMTKTLGDTGVSFGPTFSTVAGSTVNFGTLRGLRCLAPAVGIFQTSAGVENMAAYYGVDQQTLPFGGNVDKVAFRSAITLASNAYFLRNVGSAQSNLNNANLFDAGFVQILSDTKTLSLGAAGGDMQLGWNGTQFDWDPAIGDDLRWRPDASNYWELDSPVSSEGLQINLETITFGTTAADPSTSNFFVQFAGPNLRGPTAAGEYADVLWTASGSIDIGGFAATDVDAYKINAVALLLSGGSVADVSTVHIADMTSNGVATRSHALRVQGRTRIDGLMNHNESTLAQLTGDVAALALPPNNLGRFVLLQDADALGPHTIQGIVNDQVGDAVYFVNNGANAWDFGHEDGAAAAANRIITPSAATWTLGAREFAKLWYDPVATRWRILESNGA